MRNRSKMTAPFVLKQFLCFLNYLFIDVNVHLLYHLEHTSENFALIPMAQLIVTVIVKLF